MSGPAELWASFPRDPRSGGFPWPLIVNALAFLNLVRTAASKREIVAQEVKRLERKRAKALESAKKKQSPEQDAHP